MRKMLLSVIIFMSAFSLMFAKNVDIEIAKQVAKNLINERGNFKKNVELKSVNFKNNDFYVFNVNENDGYVIISNEDCAIPILGYSFSKKFETKNIAPSFQWLLDNYSKQIEFIKKTKAPATLKITEQWNKYSTKDFHPEILRDEVGPLITSVWNQCAYYNTLCPADPEACDGHVPVGCVAMAMAQIMDYYQYPNQGSGSHSYYAEGYGNQTANFGETTYNWSNIPDYLTDYNLDVETLCYHCGVSVEMGYGTHGSGAYSPSVAYALQTYFGYINTMQNVDKGNYSEEEWDNLLKNEFNNSRPIHYSGFGESGGHAFICDGYQDNNYFHFNWGWDGLFNGYYTLDNLNPRTSTFNEWQSAIIGIHPIDGPTPEFIANTTTVLTGSPINFTDKSIGIPTSWNWSFEGANPDNSNEQNPENIVYSQPGTYSVSLTVTNETGNNSITKNAYIVVTDNALPMANFTISDSVFTSNSTIQLSDQSLNSPTNYEWSFEPNNVHFENNTDQNSQNPEIFFDEPGDYQITLTVGNSNGNDSFSKTIHYGGVLLPYNEDFELTLGNTGWTTINPDSSISWDGCYFANGYTNGQKSAYVNCNAYTSVGERDGLISPLLNLANYSQADLSFKHAYANNPGHQDSLIVYISTDNGDSWNRIYAIAEDGSGNFSTHSDMEGRFTPETQDDWSEDTTISLNEWVGNSNVRIKFEVYNDNGNCLYIDDVSVTTDIVENESNTINILSAQISQNYPNPFSVNSGRSIATSINYVVKKSQNVKIDVYNIKGQKVVNLVNKFANPGKYTITWDGNSDSGKKVGSGVYFYRMRSGNYTSTKKMILLK